MWRWCRKHIVRCGGGGGGDGDGGGDGGGDDVWVVVVMEC